MKGSKKGIEQLHKVVLSSFLLVYCIWQVDLGFVFGAICVVIIIIIYLIPFYLFIFNS